MPIVKLNLIKKLNKLSKGKQGKESRNVTQNKLFISNTYSNPSKNDDLFNRKIYSEKAKHKMSKIEPSNTDILNMIQKNR